MAPEVADNKPYTEKADVYSFAITVWQMAKDKVPFQGMSREDFFDQVVQGGLRPKLDKVWPAKFSGLLTACWAANHVEVSHYDDSLGCTVISPMPLQRPSFEEVVQDLDELISEWDASNSKLLLKGSKAGNRGILGIGRGAGKNVAGGTA
jgi:hypothetical protein